MQDNVDARLRGGAPARARPVTLALQGGGAHGAFSWGVVDALLEDGRLDIEAISATSAGAMNATVMAYGMSVGGVDGARAKLAEFWRAISAAGEFYAPFRAFPWARWLEAGGMCNDFMPVPMAFQTMTQLFSPYQLNPFNLNPLKDVLAKVVDFERLRDCPSAPRLYLSATNVRTGKIKVFENKDLTADAVMASACLPTLFQAVAIDGEHYWDGGFMGNPAIFPLIYRTGSRDVLIVHINPLERKKLPTTAPEILNRMNEISFNSSLMREMRAVTFVTKLIDEGALDPAKYARINMHSINDDAALEHLGATTKLNPDWEFLCHLRDAGRTKAQDWLATNFAAVGSQSSVNLAEVYL